VEAVASELYDPPAFEIGTKVQALRLVRNDGTYPGSAIGTILINPGEIGYVKSVGTWLNRFYVYSIDFVELGMLVGMRRAELELLEAPR
jgi:nitrogen fixation protein NifZ